MSNHWLLRSSNEYLENIVKEMFLLSPDLSEGIGKIICLSKQKIMEKVVFSLHIIKALIQKNVLMNKNNTYLDIC